MWSTPPSHFLRHVTRPGGARGGGVSEFAICMINFAASLDSVGKLCRIFLPGASGNGEKERESTLAKDMSSLSLLSHPAKQFREKGKGY